MERAGIRAAHGHDPYQVVDRNGHILIRQSAIPVYELYYPYLPGMVVFGFSSGSKVEARLTDARIQFLLFTVIVALHRPQPGAAAHRRPDRAFQALTVLPTAALPLATGGDDMPVVALMLLGLVALQRRTTGAGRTRTRGGQHPQVHGLAGGVPGRCSRPPTCQRRRAAGPLRAGRAWRWWSRSWSRWPSTTRRRSSTTWSGSPSAWPGWPHRRPAPCPATSWCRPSRAIHRPYVIVVGVIGLAVLGPLPVATPAARRRPRWPRSPAG